MQNIDYFQIKNENVQLKVDNKAPLLDVNIYYKPIVLTGTAVVLTQIEDKNFKLLQQINSIYRTQVKIMYIFIFYN